MNIDNQTTITVMEQRIDLSLYGLPRPQLGLQVPHTRVP